MFKLLLIIGFICLGYTVGNLILAAQLSYILFIAAVLLSYVCITLAVMIMFVEKTHIYWMYFPFIIGILIAT